MDKDEKNQIRSELQKIIESNDTEGLTSYLEKKLEGATSQLEGMFAQKKQQRITFPKPKEKPRKVNLSKLISPPVLRTEKKAASRTEPEEVKPIAEEPILEEPKWEEVKESSVEPVSKVIEDPIEISPIIEVEEQVKIEEKEPIKIPKLKIKKPQKKRTKPEKGREELKKKEALPKEVQGNSHLEKEFKERQKKLQDFLDDDQSQISVSS